MFHLCYYSEIYVEIWTGVVLNKVRKTLDTDFVAQCLMEP
jgi:hypothetical protein